MDHQEKLWRKLSGGPIILMLRFSVRILAFNDGATELASPPTNYDLTDIIKTPS
jgi:hypothetical protein